MTWRVMAGLMVMAAGGWSRERAAVVTGAAGVLALRAGRQRLGDPAPDVVPTGVVEPATGAARDSPDARLLPVLRCRRAAVVPRRLRAARPGGLPVSRLRIDSVGMPGDAQVFLDDADISG